jgi:hypothetical protein
MSTNLKNYSKDLEFSYAPFLEILGRVGVGWRWTSLFTTLLFCTQDTS